MAVNISGSFVDDTNPMSGNVDAVVHIGIQGPEGPRGPEGGHYIPSIKQTDEDTLQFNFAPSKPDMPAVDPVQVELPHSGGNVDLIGYATEQFVRDGYQPKGNYLTEHQDISGKLDANKLPEAVNPLIDTKLHSVMSYGAKGDGTTDDTAAFQNALAENRTLFVPGGTYKLSDELKVGNHSELRLSQDTVLNFTQTTGNCITLGLMSTVTGNHATVTVPYAFSGNVVNADTATTELEEIYTLEPWSKWDPQWKYARYVTDLNITKSDSRGFHYSVNGDTSGTAVSVRADGTDDVHYMWGIHYSGLRIAGAFKYGFHGLCENDAWLHEMRVDAFIDACEIGVCLENCSNTYISAIVQPRAAEDSSGKKTPYAKYGFKLVNSKNVDLSGSRVWDWYEGNTLWAAGGEYQMVGLIGNCRGLILNAFQYYETSSDIRTQIYTDTPSNLEQMTIIQEPFTRWFKPVDGDPYFFDGENNKRLALNEDFNEYFKTDRIQAYTDVKAPYRDGVVDNGGSFITVNGNLYIEPRAFSVGDVVRIRGLDFASNYPGKAFVNLYHKDTGAYKGVINMASLISASATGTTYNDEATYDWNSETKTLTFTFNGSLASTMLGAYKYSFSGGYASGYTVDDVIMTVNEEIKFNQAGFLADDIKVKAENVIGGTGGGSSTPADWNAAEGEPGHILNRTHYDVTTVICPETILATDEEGNALLPGTFDIDFNKNYLATLNGEVVNTLVGTMEDAFILAFLDETGQPILLIIPGVLFGDDANMTVQWFTDPIDNATISIKEITAVQIPEKYIPDAGFTLTFNGADFGSDNSLKLTDYDTTELVNAVRHNKPIFLNIQGEGFHLRYSVSQMRYIPAEHLALMGYTDANAPFTIWVRNTANTSLIYLIHINTSD